MIRTSFAWFVILALGAALVLTAPFAGPSHVAFAGDPTEAPPTEVPPDTPVPTNTTAPTDTPVPTDTPQPTSTTAPTETPVPTDTVEATGTVDTEATQTAEAEEDEDEGSDDSDNQWLLWLLLIVGALAIAGAVFAFIKSRQSSEDAATAEAAAEHEAWLQSARLTFGKASSLHGDLRTGIVAAAGVTPLSDDLEWLNRQNSRLDEVGFELGRLSTSATTTRDQLAAESLQTAVGEMRGVIMQRLSPTGFATPGDYQASLARELFELDAAVRAFETTL